MASFLAELFIRIRDGKIEIVGVISSARDKVPIAVILIDNHIISLQKAVKHHEFQHSSYSALS